MRKAIIIGAGPAGLTAAYELLKRTDIIPIILEKSGEIGGISRTTNYKGNRMDMGPHRFFSKSDRVMRWWLNIMPLEKSAQENLTISYQNKTREVQQSPDANSPKDSDKAMLIIKRLTRIYFLRKFFSYPIQLQLDTLRTLGLIRTIRILLSFVWVRFFPRKPEKNLEDFIINKFGKELYLLFFKDYTEKVWGVSCHEISAEWGAQRIKGVSLSKAISQAVKSIQKKTNNADLGQKDKETSLIEKFLYPKYGPGSLWEEVARQIEEMGGKIYLYQDVTKLHHDNGIITIINTKNSQTGQTGAWEGDYFFSSMPVQELIANMDTPPPGTVQEVAAGLQYRDFINVGILLKQLSRLNKKTGEYEKLHLKDNWIYIQERDVKVGRLMIYNNWGDGMINDPDTVWIGMEYFCYKTDDLWSRSDEVIKKLAIQELETIGLAQIDDVLDATVSRMEKTYPAYFGTYDRFDVIKNYVDQFNNLFLIGRNGMHKYNNADHSMLTAMVSVDNIAAGILTKENIWSINTEQEYHEEKSSPETPAPAIESKKIPANSFKEFVWKNKWNRVFTLLAATICILQFILFKINYPYANYMPDSYSYLEAAYKNLDVNMWPVAYSKFLRIFSSFSHSDVLLVGLQYLLIEVAGLYFFFTLSYIFKPGKTYKVIIYAFLILNPVILYISNYISSDALFISFSLLWFTEILWILYCPKPINILTQAILLVILFSLRYSAIYYPAISTLAFIISRNKLSFKLAGIALGLALISYSFYYTSNTMQRVTGNRQFSAFGGWQMANNALYMYSHIPPQQRGPIPEKFSGLEKMIREHIDTISKVVFTHEDSVNSYFYLWSGKGPLIQYMDKKFKQDSSTEYFKRWASVGPLYLDYAMLLIKRYPFAFIKNFLLENSIKYMVPPVEFIGTYNMGKDSVGRLAKDWFGYKSYKVRNHQKEKSVSSLIEMYPIFVSLVNVCFLLCLIGFFLFTRLKDIPFGLLSILLIAMSFWIINASFSIVASPIVLRYQVFPTILVFSLIVILINMLNKPSVK